jgi:hypothetical protein
MKQARRNYRETRELLYALEKISLQALYKLIFCNLNAIKKRQAPVNIDLGATKNIFSSDEVSQK